ncbi:MAG: hypothetical protein LBH28_03010, partial [Oscillospiraceae bacterium]|nr:hypothetical protein [Oscillospiraceae bacterium]
MNTEYVRELAGILAAHGLTSLEINEGETRIRIEKRTSGRTPQARAQPAALAAEEFDSDAGNGANSQMLDFNHLIEIKI